jgi:cellulose synthase/poly-beta-1,6-N-acetylglucosamine synthase-like glycosyltransferase
MADARSRTPRARDAEESAGRGQTTIGAVHDSPPRARFTRAQRGVSCPGAATLPDDASPAAVTGAGVLVADAAPLGTAVEHARVVRRLVLPAARAIGLAPLILLLASRARATRVVRRLVLPAAVASGLIPLIVLLASRAGGLFDGTALGVYGLLTLLVTTLVMYIGLGHYRDPSLGATNPREWPLVSILVAVKDERAMIDRCIESLRGVEYPNLQLIVVDDGSTDGTRQRLAQIAAKHRSMKLIVNRASIGKKRALTRAAKKARGEILVFTDSDCVLAPDAVERVVRAFLGNPDVGAVSGHARALNADDTFVSKVQDTWYEGQFSVWKAAESVFGAVSCVSGPLAAFRREAIYNYLPAWANDSFLGQEFRFATDRQLTGYVLGQQRIGRRLKERYRNSPFVTREDYPERAWRVEYVKSAKVWTVVPPTMGRMLKQQVRWKKSFIRNLFFTGSFYWRKGLFPAFLYYSHVVFVLATPLLATTHLVYLPLRGQFMLGGLYLCGVFLKGCVWGLAYKAENPHCSRWVYRPFMSVMTAVLFSTLVLYSALTLRRNVWVRG